jgi:hypothetical protein
MENSMTSLPMMVYPQPPKSRRSRTYSPRRWRTLGAWLLERMEERTLLSTMWVTSIGDSGPGSLRQAIVYVNNDTSNPAADAIAFAIPGPGVHTIQPLSQLPDITHPVFIDGYTQPGSSVNTLAQGDNAVLTIELDGSQAGGAHGLGIACGQSTVRGLVVNRFSGAIVIGSSGNGNVVEGNFLGTDPTGTLAEGNGSGVNVAGDGNRIGTDGDGMGDAGERNLISGNNGDGIVSGFSFNVVAGNYIGTDATGLHSLGNSGSGVSVYSGHSNRIGTDGHSVDNIAERNVISGNSYSGVTINVSDQNVVAGNYVGTDATGELPLGNGFLGMDIEGDGNRVGTDGDGFGDEAERNVSSANGFLYPSAYSDGIFVTGTSNVIAGNFVGTDATGTQAMGNARIGIDLQYGGPNRIGTNGDGINDAAERNVISANGLNGIGDASEGGNLIAGNFIGTGINGEPLGNAAAGIDGLDPGDQVGGSPALANVIAYNGGGIIVRSPDVIGVIIRCNSIHDNTGHNIFLLGPNGFGDVNDPGDLDIGANGIQNFPVVASAVGGAATTVTGDLNSHPNTTFLVDLYASPATYADYPGGRYLGTTTVTTDATGNVHFVATVNAPTGLNELVTATATGPEGTSQYSDFLPVLSVIQPSSLSGVVFADFNDDGQVDFGEEGIVGVTVKLDGTDDLGNPVHLVQTTDADGAYVFLNLRPGSYTITETQPAGFTQGINSIGTAVGTVAGDQFTIPNVLGGVNGLNYNFGERPAATGSIQHGQTAGIGFWNNKNGQALIKALNGGTGHQLGDWLAATFPHMFGASAGSDNLVGKSNTAIAAFFQTQFVVKDQKLDAQVLATALAVYVTDATLDSTGVGTQYGFLVGGNGVATATYNVGSNGAAFGVADNTVMTVMDLLLAADSQAVNEVLYNGNTVKRNKANTVFSAINQSGGI